METKEAEVVEETGLALPNDILALVKDADKPMAQAMSKMDSLDWRRLKPNEMALLLTQKPFPAGQQSVTYLSFKQALLFALRCYELGVSPLSSEVWFNPNTGITNLTLEGKRQVARNRGIDLGPPQFEEISREWSEVPRLNDSAQAAKNAGFPKDIGVRCKIRVGPPVNQEYASYVAYLSEWYVPKSPVWQAKPMHMLQTRAAEKAISMALGTGASDPISE